MVREAFERQAALDIRLRRLFPKYLVIPRIVNVVTLFYFRVSHGQTCMPEPKDSWAVIRCKYVVYFVGLFSQKVRERKNLT